MKALTLHQPWASLWLTTRKVHETRGWRTRYRGDLAVHAARRECDYDVSLRVDNICCEEFGLQWRDVLPRGAIIGVVQLIECNSSNDFLPVDREDEACGDFGPDRWLWRRGNFFVLAEPLRIAGRQGLWNGPEYILGHGYARHSQSVTDADVKS